MYDHDSNKIGFENSKKPKFGEGSDFQLLKSLRFDQSSYFIHASCYFDLCLTGIIRDPNKNLVPNNEWRPYVEEINGRSLRRRTRADFITDDTRVFERKKNDEGVYLHSHWPHDLDRYLKQQLSPMQSTTLIDCNIKPMPFNKNSINDKRPAIGIIFAADKDNNSFIIQYMMRYDGGTFTRYRESQTIEAAKQLLVTKKDMLYSDLKTFREKVDSNHLNEVLARLRWNPKQSDTQAICIFEDTFSDRAIAFAFAYLLRERLVAVYGGKAENYEVPIVYYVPDDKNKHLTYYDTNSQEKDKQTVFHALEKMIEKKLNQDFIDENLFENNLREKDIPFLLFLEGENLTKINDLSYNTKPLWQYLADCTQTFTFYLLLDKYLSHHNALPNALSDKSFTASEKYKELLETAVLARQRRIFEALWENADPELIKDQDLIFNLLKNLLKSGYEQIVPKLLKQVNKSVFLINFCKLKNCSQLNLKNNIYFLFYHAIRRNRVNTFAWLLEEYKEEFIKLGTEEITRFLCAAIEQGFAGIVAVFFKYKILVDWEIKSMGAKNQSIPKTPIQFAYDQNYLLIVFQLYVAGANISNNYLDKLGTLTKKQRKNLLRWAINADLPRIVDLLVHTAYKELWESLNREQKSRSLIRAFEKNEYSFFHYEWNKNPDAALKLLNKQLAHFPYSELARQNSILMLNAIVTAFFTILNDHNSEIAKRNTIVKVCFTILAGHNKAVFAIVDYFNKAGKNNKKTNNIFKKTLIPVDIIKLIKVSICSLSYLDNLFYELAKDSSVHIQNAHPCFLLFVKKLSKTAQELNTLYSLFKMSLDPNNPNVIQISPTISYIPYESQTLCGNFLSQLFSPNFTIITHWQSASIKMIPLGIVDKEHITYKNRDLILFILLNKIHKILQQLDLNADDVFFKQVSNDKNEIEYILTKNPGTWVKLEEKISKRMVEKSQLSYQKILDRYSCKIQHLQYYDFATPFLKSQEKYFNDYTQKIIVFLRKTLVRDELKNINFMIILDKKEPLLEISFTSNNLSTLETLKKSLKEQYPNGNYFQDKKIFITTEKMEPRIPTENEGKHSEICDSPITNKNFILNSYQKTRALLSKNTISQKPIIKAQPTTGETPPIISQNVSQNNLVLHSTEALNFTKEALGIIAQFLSITYDKFLLPSNTNEINDDPNIINSTLFKY